MSVLGVKTSTDISFPLAPQLKIHYNIQEQNLHKMGGKNGY